MFAYVQNNQFQYFIAEGTAFTIGDIQYPANWLNLSTPEEKSEAGIVDVIYGPYPNDQYYWITQDTPVYNELTNQVYVNFSAIPKNLDQCKQNLISLTNQTAYSILLPTDWMVVKAVETGGTVAPEWNIWRQTIRTQCDDYITQVNSCTTMEQLASLPSIVWANDPNYIEPII